MGWMQGFPPPPDKLITQPDSNYFSFPKLRWSVCHLREFLPTEEISRGLGAPVPLTYLPPAEFADMRQAIDALTFTPQNSDKPMTWEQSLYANYTDGMLILHKGRVVYERYFGCLEGRWQARHHVDDQVLHRAAGPDHGGRRYARRHQAGARRHSRNRRQRLCDGHRAPGHGHDHRREILRELLRSQRRYLALFPPRPARCPSLKATNGPNGYWEYLQQVKPEGKHGDEFHYKTINSDMLGWIISRVSGKSVTELASERLWRPLGVEQDAYQTVDGKGVPFAGGGITAGLRDLGRLGQLMLNEGEWNGERLFPAEVVAKIRAGGDRAKFGSGFPTFGAGSYTSQWWVFTTTTAPMPRAACMARRSTSIRRPRWCWCGWLPIRARRTASSTRPRCRPTRRWRSI
jgi:hypothetical protein